MDKIFIRRWNEHDAAAVKEVLRSSWNDAYSSFIPQKDLDLYLEKTYSVEQLKNLSVNDNYICYVAECKKVICGWLKLFNNKNENRFYLSSIYVIPEFQKMKIGGKFFDIACSDAQELGYTEIYIGVMVQNERAINWYKKVGFEFFEEEPFLMGNTSVPHLIGKKILVNS